jgi:hypothetical protein
MERFTISGVAFFLSRQGVEQKLSGVEPESIREVYVEVNGIRYPIKQALATATGLLRGGFTTHDAMRVFRKLGIPVNTASEIDLSTMPGRCYAMLKSLNEFDKQEIAGVVRGLLAKTDRDNCFIGNYYRARANVETLLSLKNGKDLQAIAMVARGLFELAVDVKLIGVIPDAVQKIVAFPDAEKLRAAKKILKFKVAHPDARMDTSIYDSFIANNTKRIEAERNRMWPSIKKLTHWSGLDLSQRVALLKEPFDEIYEVQYPQLSWYVHSGLTGFVNLKAETLNMAATSGNKLAAECYAALLTAIIEEFGVEKADPKIKNRLTLARMLPFTDGSDQAKALESVASAGG